MAHEMKLIEGRFPCQQVGAETNRELAVGKQPPVQRLHVWWARRPLTPSRAAVLGSILPSDTDPEVFLRELGIVKKQAVIGDKRWTLVGKNLDLIESDGRNEYILLSQAFQKAYEKELERRNAVCKMLQRLLNADPIFAEDALVLRWMNENSPFTSAALNGMSRVPVITVTADPAHVNERINFKSNIRVNNILGNSFVIDPEDMYGYGRAYEKPAHTKFDNFTVLDPTAGGGSIPFEASRLGCKVIANDLNPVATIIEYATLDFPSRFGKRLMDELALYGDMLCKKVDAENSSFYPLQKNEEIKDYIYCRAVTCPHCKSKAPLLNAFALEKGEDGWAIRLETYKEAGENKVRFVPYRLTNGKGPNGEDPEQGTVDNGVGQCIHCKQAISSEEIKDQACGTSPNGTWSDEMYCVAAVRYQPKLDADGQPVVYKSGPNKGKVRTEKESFFRAPVQADFDALSRAKQALDTNWDRWDRMGMIPTEKIPEGHKTAEPLRVGVERWCDMFTPRQLLGHLTAMETLHDLIPQIIKKHGDECGKAILTYLQFMIDKCLDYNSRQTRWEYTRGVVKGTFGRHDFSLKWTFGEMIFTGPYSGLVWGKDQVVDAYKGICEILGERTSQKIRILHGSAAQMAIENESVDVICVDPPYYNNVQYAELSDYFYVWQKRTFKDLYPELFSRRLTNKTDEAVANPVRDGSAKGAENAYETLMGDIFLECRRVLKKDGLMTMMFTHKTQQAWETLTRALIDNGWTISSTFPIESEGANSTHQRDMAAAASSIFLACRKRGADYREPSSWSGFGGGGVVVQVREAVRQGLKDFEILHLNAVDEMVASYGCALKVLSENWPVIDGEEFVSPIRAMREAGMIVAQHQMNRITKGRLTMADVQAEAGIALTLFGIYGSNAFPYDDALGLSRSLNVRLENKVAGYKLEDRMIGINEERSSRSRNPHEAEGYYAPLISKGSKLRLALPEERNPKRIDMPQSEWDMMQGVILHYRQGDIPVARAYLQKQAGGKEQKILDMLSVWADGCGDEQMKKEAERILFSLK